MIQGWIKLHRDIESHWIMGNAEYMRAWIVILLRAQHSPGKALIKGRLISYDRGERLYSLDKWGALFGGWGKKKVQRFFKLLEKDGMIATESVTVTTRLRVCNYSTFQDNGNGSVPAGDTQTSRKGTEHDPRVKNVKNDKNGKNIYTGEFEAFWKTTNGKGQKLPASKSYSKFNDTPSNDILIKKRLEHEKEEGEYTQMVSTWLNQRGWEKEYSTTKPTIKYKEL